MSDAGKLELTVEALGKALFRGPVKFADGRNGMAQQDFECIAEPRLGYFWRREHSRDRGRQAYTVDGAEVADLAEAVVKLASPPDPDSPREAERRAHEELRGSPRVNHGPTFARNHAEMYADDGVFGQISAFKSRAGNAWHRGVNAYAQAEREAEREMTSWPYNAMTAAYEVGRAVRLLRRDAGTDTDLRCALGTRLRDCPVLMTIREKMEAERNAERWPSPAEDQDIVGAQIWTCMAHILVEAGHRFHDGHFFSTKEDRDDRGHWG